MDKWKLIVSGVLMLAAIVKGDLIALGIIAFTAVVLGAINEA